MIHDHLNEKEAILICPKCKNSLDLYNNSYCSLCKYPTKMTISGFLEFGVDTLRDYNHDEIIKLLNNGHTNVFDIDELINKEVTKNFTKPLIEEIFQNTPKKNVRILSAGCGIGIDVDILRDYGYQAWGNDYGSRCLSWNRRKHIKNLIKCVSELLPFPDDFFDFVQCHQVLEHVGVVGDSMELKPEYREMRKTFLFSLLRVVKPKGFLHISTPNRMFPIDPGHSPNLFGIRLHGPFDYFLNSYSDIIQYFPNNEITALSPLNYYTGTFVGHHYLISNIFNKYLKILDRLYFLRKTFLNPLVNVLIHK